MSASINTTSTFADNLQLPIHRWFRYSAGFSAVWAREFIEQEKANGRRTVLDPFAGSGTSVLEAEGAGLQSIGIEAHPFVARIAATKLTWHSEIGTFRCLAQKVLDHAGSHSVERNLVPKLLQQCFPAETLSKLFALRAAWEHFQDETPASDLVWLAIIAILRECSPVGTAQWQYVLPNKSKRRPAEPFVAFANKVNLFVSDMSLRQCLRVKPAAVILQDDARACQSIEDGWADIIVSSPPYANNYDYADATRLEMTFAGEVNGWGDLQRVVRKYLIRSCSQHVAPISTQTQQLLDDLLLRPIREEITEVCRKLSIEKELHGGKKQYDTMIAAYFNDMARTWVSLRRVASEGSVACFVIGDSAPYGVYVPVDRWLGTLAVAAGFKSFRFEKTRDRNIKWKNRKHRVPLHEGRLLVEG